LVGPRGSEKLASRRGKDAVLGEIQTSMNSTARVPEVRKTVKGGRGGVVGALYGHDSRKKARKSRAVFLGLGSAVSSLLTARGRRRRRPLACGPVLPVRETGRGPIVSRREKEARVLGRERELGRARGEGRGARLSLLVFGAEAASGERGSFGLVSRGWGLFFFFFSFFSILFSKNIFQIEFCVQNK